MSVLCLAFLVGEVISGSKVDSGDSLLAIMAAILAGGGIERRGESLYVLRSNVTIIVQGV